MKSKLILETWHSCLEDLDYNLCLMATKKAIMISSFPPTIHDIRKAAAELIASPEINRTPIEYWNEAFKMIKKGTYMTTDEFEKHSEVVKRFFGSVAQVQELAKTDLDTVVTVTKGQFLKQVEVLQSRVKEQSLLPASMKDIIGHIGSGGVNFIEGE